MGRSGADAAADRIERDYEIETRKLRSENERLRELCFDAYAVIDVLAKGVGKIATPDGFFAFWNETGVKLEREGAKPFKARVAAIPAGQAKDNG